MSFLKKSLQRLFASETSRLAKNHLAHKSYDIVKFSRFQATQLSSIASNSDQKNLEINVLREKSLKHARKSIIDKIKFHEGEINVLKEKLEQENLLHEKTPESRVAYWLGSFFSYLHSADQELVKRFDQDLAREFCSLNEKRREGEKLNYASLKTKLANLGYGGVDVPQKLGGKGRSGTVQLALQFVCGYHNIDLRDIAFVGHGNPILQHGSQKQQERWLPKMINDGALVAIAQTEEHGGSDHRKIQLTAYPDGKGTWKLQGEKCWVTRIKEASAIIVPFKVEGSDKLSIAVLDGNLQGLHYEELKSQAISGWSWCRLFFDEVKLTPEDFLGEVDQGWTVINDHFNYFRPMVAATVLGGAAAAHDICVAIQRERQGKEFARYLDSTCEKVASSFAKLESALLLTIKAQQSVSAGSSGAVWYSRLAKALATDVANEEVLTLAKLMGACTNQENHKVAKIRRDLAGFHFADGVSDALYRSTGYQILKEWQNNDSLPSLGDAREIRRHLTEEQWVALQSGAEKEIDSHGKTYNDNN